MMRDTLARVKLGGPEKHRERHVARGRMLVRDRVAAICDRGAPFLELSALANEYVHPQVKETVPAAGLVCGIGSIEGTPAMIIANDPTVKGGTLFPDSVRKQLRAQDIALENRLPTVYLVDSGGAFLPLQAEIFADRDMGGRAFYNIARLSEAGVPQLSIVLGACTAGGAYIPAMSDEVIMVDKQGMIFLGGPPLVRAATNEVVSGEELGGATLHCTQSGVADHFAADEASAFDHGRELVRNLGLEAPIQAPQARSGIRVEDPLYDEKELMGLAPAHPAVAAEINMHAILARVMDGSRLSQHKVPLQLCGGIPSLVRARPSAPPERPSAPPGLCALSCLFPHLLRSGLGHR